MHNISRERRVELRDDCNLRAKSLSVSKFVSLRAEELCTLLDYADERDEALALHEAVLLLNDAQVYVSTGDAPILRECIDDLLRRVRGSDD